MEKGEKDSLRNSSDDRMLQMREKDEGDLFGIRAIEAGFFGGVAQSAPNSPSVSRAGSRSGSPASAQRIPYGGYNPSPTTPQSLVYPQYNSHGHLTNSASSSVLDLNQYRDSFGQLSSSSSIPSIHLSKSSGTLIDHPPQVDSVFSVLSPPTVYTPSSMHHTPPQAPLMKLRPSHAELNGRITHTSPDISVDGPPSDSSGQRHSLDCPLHNSSQVPRGSTGPHLPIHLPDRASHISARESIYPSPEEWEESTQAEPARLLNGPEKKGKKTIEVGSLDNPAVDEKSQRGSIVSRITSGSSYAPQKAPSTRGHPPVPPLRLPLFSKKAIIGASNPEFDRFRKQRMPKEDGSDSDEADTAGMFTPRNFAGALGTVTNLLI
jgi:hypothetical protein